MGRDYNMTLRDAAEFIRDVGFEELQLGKEYTDVDHWHDLYAEAVTMLHSVLKTKGLKDKPSYAKSRPATRKDAANVVIHEGEVVAWWCPMCNPDNCHGCP